MTMLLWGGTQQGLYPPHYWANGMWAPHYWAKRYWCHGVGISPPGSGVVARREAETVGSVGERSVTQRSGGGV